MNTKQILNEIKKLPKYKMSSETKQKILTAFEKKLKRKKGAICRGNSLSNDKNFSDVDVNN